MVRIVVPSVWTPDGRTDFETNEGTLEEVITRFVDDNPDYRRRLLGLDSQPLGYVNICVDDYLVPRHQRAAVMVEAGSTVTIIAPMAGG